MRRRDDSTAVDGRTAAVLAIADALGGRQFASDALRAMRSNERLSGREAGLATEIAQGTLRHVVTIEHVLAAVARLDQQQTKPRLRAILLAAAYQIIWLDRVPVFAAVDEAVELARKLVHGRTPGMVNAVLRRLAGAIETRRVPWQRLDARQLRVSWGQACRFREPVLPPAVDDNVPHLAAAAGESEGRLRELIARYRPSAAEGVAWASQATPGTVLQRNPLRVGAEEFAAVIRASIGDRAEVIGESVWLAHATSFVDSEPFRSGQVYVQDATAHAAARAIAARPGEAVLDLCAAPGGKTACLAGDLRNEGVVVACDVEAQRLQRVAENAQRLGLTCVRTRLIREDGELGRIDQHFDAALVDVPCSNTGVIARRPEARLGLTPEKLRSLALVQERLLRAAAEVVRPSGRLVYSTCSLEPQENEEIVAFFLDAHPQWRLHAEETILPAWGPRLSDWRDGGYFARLVRAQ